MKSITVSATVAAEVGRVWEAWTSPSHITNWNFASADWECPSAVNDVRVGGEFHVLMRARDGSAQFDFSGVYREVVEHELLAYTMEGGRTVMVTFTKTDGGVHVSETFELEDINTEELQRAGWQSILDNFKHYVESLS